MILEIVVWYRYVSNGEQEKELDVFKVNCLGVHDGFRIIKEKYFATNQNIPFKYAINVNNAIWYSPFKVNAKDENYNEPYLNLNKEY